MQGEHSLLRIGEVARAAKVNRRTIDFYTRIGLLESVRSDGNYRLYDVSCVQRLAIIQELKAYKFTLTEIKQILTNTADPDESAIFERMEHVRELMSTLEREIAQLKPFSTVLKSKRSMNSQRLVAQGLALVHTILLVLNESTRLHQ